MTILSAGEILWDVFPNGEYLGGAPFNFAAHAARLGHRVFIVSAVGADERGRRALERAAALGLCTRYVRTAAEHATGTVTVSLDRAGQPRFTIHRPAAYDFPELSAVDLEELAAERPGWICFGTLQQTSAQANAVTRALIAANPEAQRFYDVNLRVDSYTPPLVRELMGLATFVKLNEDEVRAVEEMFGDPPGSVEGFCRTYAARFGWSGACVTRGALGCSALVGNEYVEAAGYPVRVADTVGSGDAFAAAFLHGLASGWPAPETADFANRVGALVASSPGAIPDWKLEEALSMARGGCPPHRLR